MSINISTYAAMEKGFSPSPFRKERLKRMEEMKEKIRELDKSKKEREMGFKKDRRTVHYNDKKKKFFVMEKEGEKEITVGDMVADYAWGIKYSPDDNMPEDLYYRLAKRILLNETRRDIEEMYDKELLAIKNVEDFDAKDPERKYRAGILAEKMVREFMTRLQFAEGMDFEIKRTTIEEDQKKKYDFKIIIRQHKRGVKTEGKDHPESTKLAIQFTINTSKEAQEKKKEQIERTKRIQGKRIDVDDVILVTINLSQATKLFQEWVSKGKPSGGPESLLDKEEKREIFRKITQGMISISNDKLNRII